MFPKSQLQIIEEQILQAQQYLNNNLNNPDQIPNANRILEQIDPQLKQILENIKEEKKPELEQISTDIQNAIKSINDDKDGKKSFKELQDIEQKLLKITSSNEPLIKENNQPPQQPQEGSDKEESKSLSDKLPESVKKVVDKSKEMLGGKQ